MFKGLTAIIGTGLLLFGAMPATSNYELQSYGFGSGGTANSSTSNYSLEGITGEASGQPNSTSNYSVNPGYIATQQANVPNITLTNPNNYYDKLTFSLDTQNNPSDTLYLLEVSTTSDFSSNDTYVQPDDTLGTTLSTSDYQTNAAWTASGDKIIGLSPGTNYYIRAKAAQGNFSESAYGPTSTAATSSQQITYCLYTGGSCGTGSTVAFGGLTPGAISTNSSLTVSFATNADSGGNVFVSSQNSGLKSPSSSYTIVSSTANLSSANEGYGAQVTSATQTSGGPFTSVSPYNGSADNVGGLSGTISTILSSAAPITGGSSTISLMALASQTTKSANDYNDTLTLIAAASF